MGMLDDAIREHLELKKRSGAPDEEVQRLETEAFGPPRSAAVPPPEEAPPAPVEEEGAPPEPVAEVPAEAPPIEPAPALDPIPEPVPPPAVEPEAWLEDEPDEVPATEALEHPPAAEEEDVLEETPDFLQETPEHDRLWFEQKPPRDFDFDE
jgi:hypothetical protein